MSSLNPELEAALGRGQVQRLREAVVETPVIEISSTLVRERVRSGKSIKFLVPETIRAYIESHGLYRLPASSVARRGKKK